jgi:hypothetical protein
MPENTSKKKKRSQTWKRFYAVYTKDPDVTRRFQEETKKLCGSKGLAVTRVMEWFLKQPENQQRAILAGLA